jgi:GH25 family lysozyme M1 (1,4-beta-N-acetylmuramidase)
MELDLAWQSLTHMLAHRPHSLKIDLHQSSIQTTFTRLKQQFKGIDLSGWQAKINDQQDSL